MNQKIKSLLEKELVYLPNRKLGEPFDGAYFIERSREEGEQDLVMGSRDAKGEDVFAFLENHGIWVHPNTKTSTMLVEGKFKRNSVKSHFPKFNYIDKEELGEIIKYHTHPWEILSDYYNHHLTENAFYNEFMKNILCSWLALPSGKDLQNTVLHPTIDHKIASTRGITSYRLCSGNPPRRLFYSRKVTRSIDSEILERRSFEEYMNLIIGEIKRNLPSTDMNISFKEIK